MVVGPWGGSTRATSLGWGEHAAARVGARRPPFVLVTDPGPDPDDVKALLVAAMLHVHGRIELLAVVANGGGQPRERAALARCVLDHVGATSVPVGVGSAGVPTAAQPHEYRLAGYTAVEPSRLLDGRALLVRALQRAAPRSLRVVLISSLRDFADVLESHAQLALRKVHTVAVQGGLERDASRPSGWRPDSSVNNGFDMAAAEAVYAFCLARRVRLAVVSRFAVPLLPMQLARSFAERTDCPVLRYLADAQFLGLQGLWRKLCEGKLPPRCTKEWFFATFCAEDAAAFLRARRADLDERADIVRLLSGHVKPYDVVALMTVLPQTAALFARLGEQHGCASASASGGGADGGDGGNGGDGGDGGGGGASPRPPPTRPPPTRPPPTRPHALLLLLTADAAPPATEVLNLLRDTYHEVALATGGARARAPPAAGPSAAPRAAAMRRLRGRFGQTPPSAARVLPGEPPVAPRGRVERRSELGSAHAEPLASGAICTVLERSCAHARAQQLAVVRTAALVGASCFGTAIISFGADWVRTRRAHPAARSVAELYALDAGFTLRSHAYFLCAILAGCALCASLDVSAAAIVRTRACGCALVGVVLAFGAAVLAPALDGAFDEARFVAQNALVAPGNGRGAPARVWFALDHVRVAGRIADVLLIPLLLLARVAHAWRRPRALVRAHFTATGVFACAHGTFDAYSAALQLGAGVPNPVWLFAGIALIVAAELAIGRELLRSARAHLRARALLVRVQQCVPCLRSDEPTSTAALAPLIGYGTVREREPTELVAHALALFAPERAGAALLRALGPAALHAGGRVGAGGRASAGANAGAGAGANGAPLALVPSDTSPHLLPRVPTAHSHSHSQRAAHDVAPLAAAGCATVTVTTTAAAAAATTATTAIHPPSADVYVVHSAADDAQARLDALALWAEAFERAHGRAPAVWLGSASADLSLVATELLEHMPVYMARCRRLLVLAGARTPDLISSAVEVYAWFALGGRIEEVEVAIVAPDGRGDAGSNAGLGAVVSAFDAFHAMYSLADDDTEVARRLMAAIELAGVAQLNGVLRELLPLVMAAAEHVRVRTSDASV